MKAEWVLPGSRERVGGVEGEKEEGREVVQIIYIHVSKCKNDKMKI
jgi:hypothetical protein